MNEQWIISVKILVSVSLSAPAVLNVFVLNLILTGRWCHHKSFGYLHRGRKESAEEWREKLPCSFPEDRGFKLRQFGHAMNWNNSLTSAHDGYGSPPHPPAHEHGGFLFFLVSLDKYFHNYPIKGLSFFFFTNSFLSSRMKTHEKLITKASDCICEVFCITLKKIILNDLLRLQRVALDFL